MSNKPDEMEKELFCGYCGERLPQIDEELGGTCPQCRKRFGRKKQPVRRPPAPKRDANDFLTMYDEAPESRDPVFAALLSTIVPGAGQLYNNQFFKGVLVFLSCVLVIPYFLGIFDAYITAEKSNQAWRPVTVGR